MERETWKPGLRDAITSGEVPDWVKADLMGLLVATDFSPSADAPFDWFDDANPEGHLALADAGLVDGVTWSEEHDGRMSVSLDSPHLTEEGRLIAEAALRERTASANGRALFISYVRDDSESVDSLRSRLRKAGVNTWTDTERLLPGDDWQSEIRNAIRSGVGFIACFSTASQRRERSGMREELVLACEELRLRAHDCGWFIPVVLDDDCEVPDLMIGGGRSLRDIQYVSLSDSSLDGFERLLRAIDRLWNVGLD